MGIDHLTSADRACLDLARLRSQALQQCSPDALDKLDSDSIRVWILKDWLAAAEADRAALVAIIDRLVPSPPTDPAPADPVRRGFMCSTALKWDLDPSNPKGVKVWWSEEAIRTTCKCVGPRRTGFCGVVEVEIRSVRIVQTATSEVDEIASAAK